MIKAIARAFVVSLGAASPCALGAPPAPAPGAPASAGPTIVVTLDTGETLRGVLLADDGQWVRLRHPILGDVAIPAARIAARTAHADAPAGAPPVAVAAPVAAAPAPAASAPSTAAAAPAAPPPPDSFLRGWTTTVEAGVNGSDGNTQTLNLRAGLAAERLTERMESRASLLYVYSTDSGEVSTNRSEADARHDLNFIPTPWGAFLQGKAEYDEFQDWDWRFSLFGGPTYAFIKNDRTTLKARAGAGFSYELGGADEEINPEALAGLEFTHKLDDRQSVFANAEFLPSLSNVPQYRVTAKAGYQIVVDPELKLMLKLGLSDRYDSDPGPERRRNDLEYFATVGFTF